MAGRVAFRLRPCGALIISHDRTFLDRGGDAHPGDGSAPAQRARVRRELQQLISNSKQAEIEKQWAAFTDQQAEIQRMQQDIARVKAQAAQTERQTRSARIGGPDMRNKGVKDPTCGSMAAKVAKKAKSREKQLDRYIEVGERVERPVTAPQISLAFNETPHLGRSVIRTGRV